MTVKKQLTTALQAAQQCGVNKGAQLQAFLKGVAYARKHGDWRSVMDELPELGERVLVVSLRPNGYRDMRIANLCECRNEETGEATTLWTNPIMTETITHWMPIPEPPKTE
jgi:hypothetical protein